MSVAPPFVERDPSSRQWRDFELLVFALDECLSLGGALRRGVEVPRQEPGRIRYALVPGDAVHVHDIRVPVALDHVHSVKVDVERPAAALGDVAQLRRKCEGLTQFLYFGPARKHLLDPEQLLADRVDLVIAPLGRVVALGEGGLATPMHTREFGWGAEDGYVLAAS